MPKFLCNILDYENKIEIELLKFVTFDFFFVEKTFFLNSIIFYFKVKNLILFKLYFSISKLISILNFTVNKIFETLPKSESSFHDRKFWIKFSEIRNSKEQTLVNNSSLPKNCHFVQNNKTGMANCNQVKLFLIF